MSALTGTGGPTSPVEEGILDPAPRGLSGTRPEGGGRHWAIFRRSTRDGGSCGAAIGGFPSGRVMRGVDSEVPAWMMSHPQDWWLGLRRGQSHGACLRGYPTGTA